MTKSPTQLFTEKVEQRYSLSMVAATLAVFAIPLGFGADLTNLLLRAMTFMIVASPCAVVLATMPPLLSAIANAGRHGVLVKSAVVMERLGQVDAVTLDKIGTLTEGTPRVTDIRPLTGSDLDEGALLALAAAAEHPSKHPLARAVVDAGRVRGLAILERRDFNSAPGIGVTATVNGAAIAVGAPARLLNGATDARSAWVTAVAEELENTGRTAVLVDRDGFPAGILGISDRLRLDAAATALTALTGTPPLLVTGDNPRAAARLAEEVDIGDVRAGPLPQDKVTAVRQQETARHKALVIGNDVNDAPALAAAHTGVSPADDLADVVLHSDQVAYPN